MPAELVVDDLSGGSEAALVRAAEVCGVAYPGERLRLVRADILDPAAYRGPAEAFPRTRSSTSPA